MTDTKIDWERFVARVQAGCMVRCLPSDEEKSYGKIEWRGVLLDNRPRPEDEVDGARNRNAWILKETYEWAEENPLLRFQDFDTRETDHNGFDPLWQSVNFLVDGRWVTFDQLMA
jgi:hypothetical protein